MDMVPHHKGDPAGEGGCLVGCGPVRQAPKTRIGHGALKDCVEAR